MDLIAKRHWSLRLRRKNVGCGIQGEDCLSLAVSGHDKAWKIEWALPGHWEDPIYTRQLRERVWRRPFWTHPLDRRDVTHMAVGGIDLSFGTRKKSGLPSKEEMRAAFRTQLLTRYTQVEGEPMLCGLQLQGPDGVTHLTGAVRPRNLIRHDYLYWTGTVGIIHPHVASPAAAIANLYLALYPESSRRQTPLRLVVLEGRETTMAVLLDDWRLLDALQFRMMVDQHLDGVLLGQWIDFVKGRNPLKGDPVPCVIKYDEPGITCSEYECWSPFWEQPLVKMDAGVAEILTTNPDLAALAFGMALQGA